MKRERDWPPAPPARTGRVNAAQVVANVLAGHIALKGAGCDCSALLPKGYKFDECYEPKTVSVQYDAERRVAVVLVYDENQIGFSADVPKLIGED